MVGQKRSLTTRLPITTVARKKGTQTLEATHMQSHMDSDPGTAACFSTLKKDMDNMYMPETNWTIILEENIRHLYPLYLTNYRGAEQHLKALNRGE